MTLIPPAEIVVEDRGRESAHEGSSLFVDDLLDELAAAHREVRVGEVLGCPARAPRRRDRPAAVSAGRRWARRRRCASVNKSPTATSPNQGCCCRRRCPSVLRRPRVRGCRGPLRYPGIPVSTATPSGHQPGTSAAEHLIGSFPGRAAGRGAPRASCAPGRPRRIKARSSPRDAPRLPRRRDPRRRPDHVRTAPRRRTPRTHRRTSTASPSSRPPTTSSANGRMPPSTGRIRLDPGFRDAAWGRHPGLPRRRRGPLRPVAMRQALYQAELPLQGRSLVILDEVHHGGDALSRGAKRSARR